MLPVSDAALAALTGSHTPYLRADVWYDGQIVVYDLPVTGGQVEAVDDGDAIRKRLTLSIANDDGSLVPRSDDAPLAPYGSRITVRAGVEVGSEPEAVSLGWFRVETCNVDEAWRVYDRVDGVKWVSSGGDIDVTGVDLAEGIKDSQFGGPTQPIFPTSVRAEIVWLCNGLVGVGAWPGVTDAAIPATLTYTDDRWAAICELAFAVNAVPYIDQYGDLILRPNGDTTPVWEVTADPDYGVLVSAPTRLSRAGIYNATVTQGTTADQVPVIAYNFEGSGPLRWDGPFGRVPWIYSSSLVTSTDEAHIDSLLRLNRHVDTRSFPLEVECVTNYWLEVGDTVTVGTPYGSVDGRVTQATWPLVPGAMRMTVVVPRTSLWSRYGEYGLGGLT